MPSSRIAYLTAIDFGPGAISGVGDAAPSVIVTPDWGESVAVYSGNGANGGAEAIAFFAAQSAGVLAIDVDDHLAPELLAQYPADPACDFDGTPNAGQLFAINPDGGGLRALTQTRGLTVHDDGSVSVEIAGPFANGPHS